MKKIGFIVGVILIGSLCFGVSRIIQNPDQYQKQNEEIPIVLDCSKFSRISTEELFAELGDPERTEDWNSQTSKGEFPMKIYAYSFDGFMAEFIAYEDTVVKLHLFSDTSWAVEGKADNIFAMFGVTPSENAKKTVDTGTTYKFSPVSDKVAEIEFYNYDEEDKTFDTVYVTYNLNYFD